MMSALAQNVLSPSSHLAQALMTTNLSASADVQNLFSVHL